MKYENVIWGRFLSRVNRFTAWVAADGATRLCHVRNTGRLGELLVPGVAAALCRSFDPARKTGFDLIAVEKDGALVNVDSLAPNRVAMEYLQKKYPDARLIRPEYAIGGSRLDFYVERADKAPLYVEVKGVTLLENDAALFPDAPTVRGMKHLALLSSLAQSGADAMALFAVAMKGAAFVAPNPLRPEYCKALRSAADAGVALAAFDCAVGFDSLTPDSELPVRL